MERGKDGGEGKMEGVREGGVRGRSERGQGERTGQ